MREIVYAVSNVNLPCGGLITEDNIKYVVENLKRAINE